MSKPAVSASFWWQSAGTHFERVVREFLTRAKAADLKATGHDCGHEWTITVSSRGHYGIAHEGPESHSDANYADEMRPIVVRAHNLRDALLLAAAEPLGSWLEDEEDEDG